MPALKNLKRWLVPLLFGSYFLFGLSLVPDYGISWDEAVQRGYGVVAYDFVMQTFDPDHEKLRPRASLERNWGRYYGLWFSLSCFLVEKQLGWVEEEFTRQQFLLRHYAIFSIFFIALICFYNILRRRFKDWKFALLGTLMLILMPRIFAHSFFNPKDIIFLSTYVFSIFTLIKFIKTKSLKNALVHGFACALVVNTRIPGLIIPAFTIFLILLEFLQNFKPTPENDISPIKKYIKSLPLFILTGITFTILLSPAFWVNPVENMQASFNVMSNYDWKGSMLFFGKKVYGGETPWYYIPGWIGVTTPISYLILFILGVVFILINSLKRLFKFSFFKTEANLIDITLLGLFLGPLLAVIYKESTLYDGWRQLFFIGPPLVGIALIGFYKIWNYLTSHSFKWLQYSRWLLLCILISSMGHTTYEMVKYHPIQNVWFNQFAREDLTTQFDLDYWGVCYKKAFEELAKKYPYSCTTIKCVNYPCEENYRFIEEELKEHLVIQYGPKQAEFHISNYRMRELKWYQLGVYPYEEEVFTLDFEGNKVIGVYKDLDYERWFREEQECP